MTAFDQAFKSAFAKPFEGAYQFKHPQTAVLYEVVGIFTATQITDRINGAPVKHMVCTLEFDSNYLAQLPIAINAVFIINGDYYRITKTPFIDDIGWVTVDISKTSAG